MIEKLQKNTKNDKKMTGTRDRTKTKNNKKMTKK